MKKSTIAKAVYPDPPVRSGQKYHLRARMHATRLLETGAGICWKQGWKEPCVGFPSSPRIYFDSDDIGIRFAVTIHEAVRSPAGLQRAEQRVLWVGADGNRKSAVFGRITRVPHGLPSGRGETRSLPPDALWAAYPARLPLTAHRLTRLLPGGPAWCGNSAVTRVVRGSTPRPGA